jgi:plastocyanin
MSAWPWTATGRAGAALGGLLLLLASAACGGEDPGAEPDALAEPTEIEERNATAPAELQAIDPATAGAVRGTVRFTGEPAERHEIPLVRECRLHEGTPLLTEGVIVGPEGGLADVLVHVRRGLAAYALPPPGDAAPELDQLGCRYVPHVLAVRAGQTLRVHNSDPLTHNVRVRAPRNGVSMNRSQARGSSAVEIPLSRAELAIRVGCDLHPWMGAVVHVLDHPFFALTGTDGRFAIEGLPPGEYQLEALHPALGRRRATVRVEPGGAVAEADFAFAEE